jgi:hypothetical protein
MAEQPEEVLPEERVRARGRAEEVAPELAVEHQEEQGHGDDRHGEEEEELGDQRHPREDRHAEQAHARRPHVDDRDDEVHGPGQRGDAQDLQAEEPVVHVVAGHRAREGGVAEPAAVGRAAQEEARVHEQPAHEEGPVPEGVEAGEGDVASPDLERHQVVGQSRRQGHDHEEDHGRAVHGEDLVVGVGAQHGVLRRSQLQAEQERLEAADEEERESGRQVEDADLLVVDGRDPRPGALGVAGGPAEEPDGLGRRQRWAGFGDDRHQRVPSGRKMTTCAVVEPGDSRLALGNAQVVMVSSGVFT